MFNRWVSFWWLLWGYSNIRFGKPTFIAASGLSALCHRQKSINCATQPINSPRFDKMVHAMTAAPSL